MIKQVMSHKLRHFCSLTTILSSIVLALFMVVLTLVIIPVQLPEHTLVIPKIEPSPPPHVQDVNHVETIQIQSVLNDIRPGMFKTPCRLRQKPKADKTVEKILAQLNLRCITNRGDQSVAYISVKGAGLKCCAIGDSVEDKFRVLDIHEKSVDIDIAGQTLVLGL